MPRAGAFRIGELADCRERVRAMLAEYADNCDSGKFATRFEAPRVI